MIKTLVFDGDDTLWDGMGLYTDAKEAYAALLQKEGISRGVSLETLNTVDLRNVDLLGFSRKRFPLSMTQAYDELCRQTETLPKNALRKQLARIGDSVFSRPVSVYPSTIPALNSLRHTYKLVLCTKGEEDVQKQKIEQSGLGSLFDGIDIVASKDEHVFAEVLQKCDALPSESCSVGNSLRSDINPAILAGMYAIWIPNETWAYEEGIRLAHERLFRISSLEELPKFLEKLD